MLPFNIVSLQREGDYVHVVLPDDCVMIMRLSSMCGDYPIVELCRCTDTVDATKVVTAVTVSSFPRPLN